MDCLRVFVLGPARSGTSALLLALHEVFDLPAEGESHVVPGFQRAIHSFSVYCEQFGADAGVLASQLDRAEFHRHVVGYMRAFYAKAFPGGSFADKTPGAEAIAGAPLIRQTFPDARIIVTRRTGIAVVQSHMRKFNASFEDACSGWTACMKAIEEVRPTASDLLELDHQELATEPGEAAIRLCRYLHRTERCGELEEFLRTNQVDRSAEHDLRRMPRLADADWTSAQKDRFRDICGPHMRTFGYPM